MQVYRTCATCRQRWTGDAHCPGCGAPGTEVQDLHLESLGRQDAPVWSGPVRYRHGAGPIFRINAPIAAEIGYQVDPNGPRIMEVSLTSAAPALRGVIEALIRATAAANAEAIGVASGQGMIQGFTARPPARGVMARKLRRHAARGGRRADG